MWQEVLQVTLVVMILPYVQPNSCSSSQKLCTNGACVDPLSPCPHKTCRTIPAQCKAGKCKPKQEICEQKKCRAGMKSCPDGSCILSFRKCPATRCPDGLKPCDDGMCILTSMECGSEEDECPNRCRDGRCIGVDSYCPEDMCPYWKNNKCDDGDCFTNAERCNGIAYCVDGSDENDCEEYNTDILDMLRKWPWWVYLIAVGLFILLCLIIALCCRYQRKQSRAKRLRRAQRQRRLHQASQPYSQEMPVVAGRRMTPVPTSTTGGSSTPTPASYQPVPTQPAGAAPHIPYLSASSPYNPAFATPPPAQSPYPLATGASSAQQGAGPCIEPTAPPLAPEAPPPYSEAIRDSAAPPQPGIRPTPYLPSYDTVQRGGP